MAAALLKAYGGNTAVTVYISGVSVFSEQNKKSPSFYARNSCDGHRNILWCSGA